MDLTAADFDGERLTRAPGTAAVVFVADWCGFCRRFLRQRQADAASLPVPFLVADVSDEESPLWDTFRVKIVPTIVLFRDGAPVWRRDGVGGLGLTERDWTALKAAADGLARSA